MSRTAWWRRRLLCLATSCMIPRTPFLRRASTLSGHCRCPLTAMLLSECVAGQSLSPPGPHQVKDSGRIRKRLQGHKMKPLWLQLPLQLLSASRQLQRQPGLQQLQQRPRLRDPDRGKEISTDVLTWNRPWRLAIGQRDSPWASLKGPSSSLRETGAVPTMALVIGQ